MVLEMILLNSPLTLSEDDQGRLINIKHVQYDQKSCCVGGNTEEIRARSLWSEAVFDRARF